MKLLLYDILFQLSKLIKKTDEIVVRINDI